MIAPTIQAGSRSGSDPSVTAPAQMLSRVRSLPMIARRSASIPFWSAAMGIEARTAILEHLGRQHQAMMALLADLVNIDSGSYNKRGVDAVGERLRAHLEGAGIVCETIPNATFGDCMAARLSGSGDGRPIVLMGHRDTVFPDGTVAQRPFRIDGNQAFG